MIKHHLSKNKRTIFRNSRLGYRDKIFIDQDSRADGKQQSFGASDYFVMPDIEIVHVYITSNSNMNKYISYNKKVYEESLALDII